MSESGGACRADFYLFSQFLMGLGTFNDRHAIAPRAMKFIFGMNRPFRILLGKKWYEARAALLAGNTPHHLNGEKDWQTVLWVEPESSLEILLDACTLEGRSWALHNSEAENSETGNSLREVVQSVGKSLEAPEALRLAEHLLRAYGGILPVPAVWDEGIKQVIKTIRERPGTVSLPNLARTLEREETALAADFRRVAGMSLESFLHRCRLGRYFSLRSKGVEREEALEQSSLPGWEGLADLFLERYALSLETLEMEEPFVRLFPGEQRQASLYL